MRGEVLASFHFKPQHCGLLEDVLLTAPIELYEKSARDRKKLKGIGFSERDFVAYHHVLALGDFYVSANHDPEVGSIRPRIRAQCDTPQVAASYAVGETGSRCLAFADVWLSLLWYFGDGSFGNRRAAGAYVAGDD